ncbi:hypothetical protein PX127_32200, partial [Pseudomonas aeruginosa]|nr:hypothetical protein [Pseudomonas aeruginosa]
TGNTLPRIDLGAVDELGDSTGITPPGTDPSAGGELGVATGNTLPRIDLGAVDELGGATGTTSPGTDFGAGGELGGS